MSTRVSIAGCCGRMGRALVRLVLGDDALQLTGAFTIPDDPLLGNDAGLVAGVGESGIAVSTLDHVGDCDVVIDFTLPESSQTIAAWCATRGAAHVCGTTGLTDDDFSALDRAATAVPVLWAPNMSVGVNLLLLLVEQTARRLGPDWDVEITESHHRHKIDAPSGTAKALLSAVCSGREVAPLDVAIYGREGNTGSRKRGSIGVHALRLGEIVGEHDVHFGSAEETLILSHKARNRDTFAAGALRVAKWIHGKPAGRYAMHDVLGTIVQQA